MENLKFLTGQSINQLIPFQGGPFLVHHLMAESLDRLIEAAKKDGFDLKMTSSFRSFEAQKSIWNNKASGLKAVLDSDSRPVDLSSKTPQEILFLILRWSALPGASRHHWGTDIDLFDQSNLKADYKVQLIPSEYVTPEGPFYEANLWLSENMDHFGFFRPYAKDHGGIAPEPWHLSFRELSESFLEDLTFDLFLDHLNQSDFLLINEARVHSSEIYQRFVQLP